MSTWILLTQKGVKWPGEHVDKTRYSLDGKEFPSLAQ
jgi:hypothetical protein